MALEPGPESRVRTPGARESDESSEVAKVRVTKGREGVPWARVDGGKRDFSMAADDAGKVSSSDMVARF